MSFYKYPIYDIPSVQPIAMGNRPQTVLKIFVNAPEYGQEEILLLSKIIGATRINPQEIQTIILGNVDSMVDNIVKEGLFISFRIEAKDMGFQCDNLKYQLINIDKATLLFVDNLPMIKTAPDLKKALWSNLKLHFNL